jgi:hypothetical protein
MDILSDGHFVRWTFCQTDILSNGHFVKWTFHQTDIFVVYFPPEHTSMYKCNKGNAMYKLLKPYTLAGLEPTIR